MTGSPHRLGNPETLAPAVGFSHAVVAAPGQTVYVEIVGIAVVP
jgi:hypothetical protein